MAETAARPTRVECVDLLRGWAVIVMIETHVMNATLLEGSREGAPFHALTFLNGLVAPSFIFASGMAFAITLRRKMADIITARPALGKQMLRLLMIMAIGYVLHIPKFSWSHLMQVAEAPAWRSFLQVDVLQCIAVSLLGMLGLVFILRTERRVVVATALLAVFVVFASPLVRNVEWTAMLPLSVAAYLTTSTGSLFPLFPWSAYLLAGVLAGYLFLQRQQEALRWFLRAALGAFALSFVLDPVFSRIYPVYDYWHGSPSFFLLRLGLVLLLLTAMRWYEQSHGVKASSWVTLIGRESLIVYVAHLTLIFGDFGPFNFQKMINRSLDYSHVLVVSAGLIVLMALLALFWSRLKKGPLRTRRIVEWGFVSVLIIIFFVAPA
jgi:uncharacterized membrane protein